MGDSTFWGAVGGAVGGFLGGPEGAAGGVMFGGLAGAWLPGPAEISKKIFTDLAKDRIVESGSQAWSALSGDKQELLGQDLPRAFRDAFLDAVYDIGGPLCFSIRKATTDSDFETGEFQWQY